MKIFVNNLSEQINEEGVKNLFAAYGKVAAIRLITNKTTDRAELLAFVEMPDRDEGHKAIRELNSVLLMGKYLELGEVREPLSN